MRAIVLMIAVAAASLAADTMAAAATKHHRHHPRHVGIARTAPPVAAGAYAAPSYAPRIMPGACVTDEGGGRLSPCNQGNAGGGAGAGGGGGGGM